VETTNIWTKKEKKNMSFSLQKLNPRHYKILDLAISGLSPIEISKHLSMTPTQINNILRSPSFQHQFAIRRQTRENIQDTTETDTVKDFLRENAQKAASKLVSSIDSIDEKIAIKSASEILDRSGYPKEQQQQSIQDNSINITIDSTEFTLLKESLDMISAD